MTTKDLTEASINEFVDELKASGVRIVVGDTSSETKAPNEFEALHKVLWKALDAGFISSAGTIATSHLGTILRALRIAAVAGDVEAALMLIAGHAGKTLIGDGTYSEGVHDGFNTLAAHAEVALARLRQAREGGG
jgi:hypothetical protein